MKAKRVTWQWIVPGLCLGVILGTAVTNIILYERPTDWEQHFTRYQELGCGVYGDHQIKECTELRDTFDRNKFRLDEQLATMTTAQAKHAVQDRWFQTSVAIKGKQTPVTCGFAQHEDNEMPRWQCWDAAERGGVFVINNGQTVVGTSLEFTVK